MSDRRQLDRDSPGKLVKLSTLIAVLCLLSSIAIAARDQPGLEIKVLPPSVGGQCPSVEERERVRNEIHQVVNESIHRTNALYATYTCNGTPGWKRIAFINMTDTNYSCPTGLNLTSYSKRTCGRSHLNSGCSSTTFDIGSLPYSQVCGRIKGYQFGATVAFYYFNASQSIDGRYVAGVSLTHGTVGNREHIWTFIAGLTESENDQPSWYNAHCPCDRTPNHVINVPSFIGNDYFCESGVHFPWNNDGRFYILFPDDPLWDGQNCTVTSTCCEFNNPPWFTKTLNASTTDDVELRICATKNSTSENILLELIELYVQ